MYYYEDGGQSFIIYDEDGNTVAQAVGLEADAKEIVAALNLVERIRRQFPGIEDGEEEVNGADLVDFLSQSLHFDADGRYSEV